MKLTLSTLLGLVALASAVVVPSSERQSYEGYKVYRLSVGQEVDKVADIIERLGLTTWKGAPRAGAVSDIVVPPSQVEAFLAEISGMEVVTMHEDLGLSIEDEASFRVNEAGLVDNSWFTSYHSYNDHVKFLSDLQAQYPTQSQVVSAGNSLNGNAIQGIHFWGEGGKGKPAVVFHGTAHAREWISTMVVEYFAYRLLNSSTTAEVKGFLNKYDFVMFPVVNPDGFLYSQTTDRLWRKNRQTIPGSTCLGHDINRNWPYQWNVTGGASTSPCAADFKGRSAGDAPETAAISSWLVKTKASQGLKLFIDWHSYSQLFMTPYGYSCSAVAPNDVELQSLAKGVGNAIRAVYGTSFTTGPICSTIYKATGSSTDYAYDVAGAQYSFAAELRDTGNYGFVLPASQIIPSGEEAYAGVRYLLLNMK